MRFLLTEPLSPRYIHVNTKTNKVHLLVTVVGGQEISTDNTCKSSSALRAFFSNEGASRELNSYKEALELDMHLLSNSNPHYALKKERLDQINIYLQAIKTVEWSYPDAITRLHERPSNVYSIQLRPFTQDLASNVINPVFSIDRRNHREGAGPLSALYCALHSILYKIKIAQIDPRTDLINSILASSMTTERKAALKSTEELPSIGLSGVNLFAHRRHKGRLATLLAAEVDTLDDSPPILLKGKRLRKEEEAVSCDAREAKRGRREEEECTVASANEYLFLSLQTRLAQECKTRFGLAVDFTRNAKNEPIDRTYIDGLMGFDSLSPVTAKDYVDALLGTCASTLWENIPLSPFYNMSSELSARDKTEYLSICTQFYLANLNVYCRSKKISKENFGTVLDSSASLSNKLVTLIATALSAGTEVEEQISVFFNHHSSEFALSRPLSDAEIILVKEQFIRTYKTITATNENPHMDDFLILDKDAIGEEAKFVTHQGSICVNFVELINPASTSPDAAYFTSIREDFTPHPGEIPHRNDGIAHYIDMDVDTLLTRLDFQQIDKLPKEIKALCSTHSLFMIRRFLQYIVYGQQDEATAFLMARPTQTQIFLSTAAMCTDYSGRTFDCTAYEYAYWAKDIHMCRMLEDYMDNETLTLILRRIQEMERIDEATGQPKGLSYKQNGIIHHGLHFDLMPLHEALQTYVIGYKEAISRNDWNAIKTSWLTVGLKQRDLPAHIAHEYCRTDRSFATLPSFSEPTLPRTLTIQSFGVIDPCQTWFPAVLSPYSLGTHFGLLKGRNRSHPTRESYPDEKTGVSLDLAAMKALDRVRTADMIQARARLAAKATISEEAGDMSLSLGV